MDRICRGRHLDAEELYNCRSKKYCSQQGLLFLIIFGLALGIAVFILAVLYSGYNSGFDSFHHDADAVHMVVRIIPSGNKGEQHTAYTPLPLMPALQAEYPEIEEATRFSRSPKTIVRNQDQIFYEHNILTVDPNFLAFFDFKMKMRSSPHPLRTEYHSPDRRFRA